MENNVVSNSLNSIVVFCLGINMSKYLDFTNEISLSVHRKTSENDIKKTEILNNFLSLVFTANHLFKALNLKTGTGGKKIGREDRVQDQLRNMNIHKSKGPNKRQPRMLRELAGVIAKLFSNMFEEVMAVRLIPQQLEIKGKHHTYFLKRKKEDHGNY